MDFIKQFTVETQPNSQVKLTGEIPFSELETERGKAIAHLGKNLKIDGFREGHIPDKVIIERLGEMAIVNEMAERAINRIYPLAIKELGIDAIGYPSITITKIAPANPLGFTATVAVVPTITLPDYKARAKAINTDKPSLTVTDEDVETAIKDIQRQKAAYERLQGKAAAVPAHDHVHDENCDHDHEGHEHHHDPEVEAVSATPADEPTEGHDIDTEELPLPELTDEYVQSLGKFESVDDFKKTIREHLTIEKERDVTAAHRARVTDAIIEVTEMELPQILIDSELDQMFGQMTEDLTRANLHMEDYLKHIKKTKEDLNEEWKPAAEKRAKLQLILNEIAKQENVTPDTTLVDEQVATLMERYPDADKARVRIYVESVLKNEAVMKLLETA